MSSLIPLLALTAFLPAQTPGPSIVFVDGYRLMVQHRNEDGTLAPPEPYTIRGVVWSPAGSDTNTSPFDSNNADVRRAEFAKWYEHDIPLLAAMNVNTVRLLIDPGFDPALGPLGLSVLDELYANGIMVVMTVDDAILDLQRVQGAVSFYKNHPAVLMWSLGSEWQINNYFGVPRPVECPAPSSMTPGQPNCPELLAADTEQAAQLIRSLDTFHPIATSYGDIDIDTEYKRLADTSRYVNEVAPTVDVWSINAYRGSNFGTLFSQWESIAAKPMFVGEFGTDAFRSCGLSNPPPGSSDEELQAAWVLSLWNDLVPNFSAVDPDRVALGGTVFEWNDEWWKVSPFDAQTPHGFYFPNAHPDDFANEEYFGIVDIFRNPRLLFETLQDAFRADYQPDPTLQPLAVVIDFSTLPDRIETNIPAFPVTGGAPPGSAVTLNGAAVATDEAGNFASRYPLDPNQNLVPGDNELQLVIDSGQPTIIEKVVHYDPSLSTKGRQLLYIDSVAPNLPGTVVVDVERDQFLGLLDGLHVRGISPDGKRLYFENRTVWRTDTHTELPSPESPLAFNADIPANGFIVSPDGERLYSRDEVVDVANNTDFQPGWGSVVSGTSYMGAPIPGGPAITPDSRLIYCRPGLTAVAELDTVDFSFQTRSLPNGGFQSDLTVSGQGDVLARTQYAAGGNCQFFSLPSLAQLSQATSLGDFAGEVVFTSDGNRAIVGSAGNPANRGGGLSLVDVASGARLGFAPIDLADNLTISRRDEIFNSTGNRLGVDSYRLDSCGGLARSKSFFLGINRFVPSIGIPRNDEIRRIVLKDVAILSIERGGTGMGRVTADLPGIDCGADCRESFDFGETVQLQATPDFGSTFAGWEGDPDCGDGALTLDQDKRCVADFRLLDFSVTVDRIGTGGGHVASEPPGIDCGVSCGGDYPFGTVVTLIPSADPGSEFLGWSGDSDCIDGILTIDSNRICSARFDLRTFDLTVARAGDGDGVITSGDGLIDCGSECAQSYPDGSHVTLAATASGGSVFVEWSGDADCGGDLVMDRDRNCVATFLACHLLTLTHNGQGSDPSASPAQSAGCPAGRYVSGEAVELTAVPAAMGYSIGSWTGTLNDGSRSERNMVAMPGADHLAAVNYIEGFDPPVAIRLISFSAVEEEGRIRLVWETGFEVDNLGFHLYRLDQTGLRRVTRSLVAGSALQVGGPLTTGSSYSWLDVPGSAHGSPLYWLEDWDLSGKRTLHGPARPIKGAPPRDRRSKPIATATHLNGLGREDDGSTQDFPAVSPGHSTPDPAASPPNLAANPRLKLVIRGDGLRRVTAGALADAGLGLGVDPRKLHLSTGGVEVPCSITGEEDGRLDPEDLILFYGTGDETPWSDARVYWLSEEDRPGLRFPAPVRETPASDAVSSFRARLVWRPRTIYFPALLNGDAENFFGPVVADAAVIHFFSVTRPDPAPGEEPSLEVKLQGVSGKHRVSVTLNDQPLGWLDFSGQEGANGVFKVPSGLLRSGENRLELVGGEGGEDISLVDRVELTYSRRLMAQGNRLAFSAPPSRRVTVQGFTDPAVLLFDVTDPFSGFPVEVVVSGSDGAFSATFDTEGATERRFVAGTAAVLPGPEGMVANRPSSWKGEHDGADAVILVHKAVEEELARLRLFRQSQGWTVLMVDVEDLYDEYSFGSPTPYAIRAFMRDAAGWNTVPRFLLLAGDATYDPKGYLGPGRHDSVPTRIVGATHSETALDDWFGDLDGDGKVDLAVGRLPVETREEARATVDKIIDFEDQAPAGPWRSSVTLVSDHQGDVDFDRESHELARWIPAEMTTTEINNSERNAAILLRRALDRGQRVVSYLGHGSVRRWAGGLLEAGEASRLGNGRRLPFVLSMACLTGYFQGRDQSLAEALMNAPEGGAMGVLASPSLDGARQQVTFAEAVFRILFEDSTVPLGEVVRRAKREPGVPASVSNYTFFGDPMSRIAVPGSGPTQGWIPR